MSLHEAADGILETHVTWDDIEKDLQKNLGTKATFGENKKATNISDMKGFMSRIACVEPDWQNVEEGMEEQLPKKFALKIASQLALVHLSKLLFDEGSGAEKMNGMAKITREAHNREVETYRLLQRYNHPNIPYTKVFALKSFDDEHDLKGYMILDFVTNVHTVGMFNSLSPDDVIPVIRGVATFAALGENLKPEEKTWVNGSNFLETLFEEFYDEKTLIKNFGLLQTMLGERNRERSDKLIEIFKLGKKILKKYSNLRELLGFKYVLNHGDLWQSNMIHCLGEDGKLNLKAMIDWQTVSCMSPGMDLSRLIMGCLSGKDSRAHKTELLQLYHQTFVDVLGREVFSFQELEDQYNMIAPMTAMLLMPGTPSFLEQANLPEEELKEVKEAVNEKMIAMMEDVIEAHEHNLEKFPNFFAV